MLKRYQRGNGYVEMKHISRRNEPYPYRVKIVVEGVVIIEEYLKTWSAADNSYRVRCQEFINDNIS